MAKFPGKDVLLEVVEDWFVHDINCVSGGEVVLSAGPVVGPPGLVIER